MLRQAITSLLHRSRRAGQATDAEAAATRLGLGGRTGKAAPSGTNHRLGAAAQPWKLGHNDTGSAIPALSLVVPGIIHSNGYPRLAVPSEEPGETRDFAVTAYPIPAGAIGRYYELGAHVIRVTSDVGQGDIVHPFSDFLGHPWPLGGLRVRSIVGDAGGGNQYAVAARIDMRTAAVLTAIEDYNSAVDPPTVLAKADPDDEAEEAVTVILRYRGTQEKGIEYPNVRQDDVLLATLGPGGTWVCTGPHDAPLVGPGSIQPALFAMHGDVEYPEESGVHYTEVQVDWQGNPIRIPWNDPPGWTICEELEARFPQGGREGLIDSAANILQEPLKPNQDVGTETHEHTGHGKHGHDTFNLAEANGDARFLPDAGGQRFVADPYEGEHGHGSAGHIPPGFVVLWLKRIK